MAMSNEIWSTRLYLIFREKVMSDLYNHPIKIQKQFNDLTQTHEWKIKSGDVIAGPFDTEEAMEAACAMMFGGESN